jgi:hypothetical protein
MEAIGTEGSLAADVLVAGHLARGRGWCRGSSQSFGYYLCRFQLFCHDFSTLKVEHDIHREHLG